MSFNFSVNNTPVTAHEDGTLLPFLRELGLTSVKDGCSQGACGACTVIIDGKARKSCTVKLSSCTASRVVTCEGLTSGEREIYSYAFTHCGAVQCGFCTPGMVMSAKALLDVNPAPTTAEIREALKGNICRCTGYQKIVEAVALSGRLLLGEEVLPQNAATPNGVGDSFPRIDAPEKVLGTAKYTDDIQLPGMLFGGAVRSEFPRAVILSIDTAKAKALPQVTAVLTAADLKGELKIGHLKKDQYVLVPVGAETHYLGDPIVLIAAETKQALAQAKALIKVEYQPLPPVLSIGESMADDAPKLFPTGNILAHERLIRGDAAGKIAAATHVVTMKYSTPPTEHAFLEPESAVALPEKEGVLVYCGDQGVFQTKREVAEATGLPPEKVRVEAKLIGGGFGGKEDMTVQHHGAILALACNRPVKFTLTRDESILVHPKRHAMELEFTTACDENGILTAMKAKILSDTGAFASLGGPVLQRACTHAAGPYNYHDIDIEGWAYYTNNPPAGAFRGFGVTQSCFACEQNLNLLATKVGISPWEIRRRNAIKAGDILPNGQLADESTAFVETLEAVKPYYDAHPSAGVACAMKNSGLGVGIPDYGRCRLAVIKGVANIFSSAACIGQGMGTVAVQMVCEATGLHSNFVHYNLPDSGNSPDSGNTTASRQTLFTGEAVRLAALKLKAELANSSLDELNGREYTGEFSGVTDPLASDVPNPISHVAYGYATHLVDLDEDGKVLLVIAAHDVGKAINPTALEGQIHGGVVMGLGFGLTENFPLKDGRPTAKFGTLGLLRANQIPQIRTVLIEKSSSPIAFGAKGVGEICAIPTAPAAALAYCNRDGRFRTTLPLEGTPYSRVKP